MIHVDVKARLIQCQYCGMFEVAERVLSWAEVHPCFDEAHRTLTGKFVEISKKEMRHPEQPDTEAHEMPLMGYADYIEEATHEQGV